MEPIKFLPEFILVVCSLIIVESSGSPVVDPKPMDFLSTLWLVMIFGV